MSAMPRSPSVSSRWSTPRRANTWGSARVASRLISAPEGGLQFAAVGLEHGRAAIREEVAVLGIDDDGNAALPRPASIALVDHLGHQHALVVVLEHERVGRRRSPNARRRAGASISPRPRSASSSSSTRTSCCDARHDAGLGGGGTADVHEVRQRPPTSRRASCAACDPAASVPTAATRWQWAPSAQTFCATLAAPPSA